jgi:hypothetical protein
MLAMALGRIRANQAEAMRSLLARAGWQRQQPKMGGTKAAVRPQRCRQGYLGLNGPEIGGTTVLHAYSRGFQPGLCGRPDGHRSGKRYEGATAQLRLQDPNLTATMRSLMLFLHRFE